MELLIIANKLHIVYFSQQRTYSYILYDDFDIEFFCISLLVCNNIDTFVRLIQEYRGEAMFYSGEKVLIIKILPNSNFTGS